MICPFQLLGAVGHVRKAVVAHSQDDVPAIPPTPDMRSLYLNGAVAQLLLGELPISQKD